MCPDGMQEKYYATVLTLTVRAGQLDGRSHPQAKRDGSIRTSFDAEDSAYTCRSLCYGQEGAVTKLPIHTIVFADDHDQVLAGSI